MHAVIRSNTHISFTTYPPNSIMLQNCSTISQSEFWHLFSQGKGYVYHKNSSCGYFYSQTHLPFLPTSLTTSKLSSVFYFYYITPRLLYKWNYAVCNLLGLAFPLSVLSEASSILINSLFLLLLSRSPMRGFSTVCIFSYWRLSGFFLVFIYCELHQLDKEYLQKDS